jgi:hypothetical protein
MTISRRVVICGTSIFAMAIGKSLDGMPGMDVVHFDPHRPGVVEQISALSPDAVVVERDQIPEGLMLKLLKGGFPLLELDADKGILATLDRRQVPAHKVEDLARVIEQVAAGDR